MKNAIVKLDSSFHYTGQQVSIKYFLTIEECIEQLSTEAIDELVLPLDKLPVEYPDNIVIGALSKRSKPNFILIASQKLKRTKAILDFESGVDLKVCCSYIKNLLADMNHNFRSIEKMKTERILELFSSGNPIAAVLPHFYIENGVEDYEGFDYQELSSREFVPQAGAGVIAFLCRKDDIERRSALKVIHFNSMELVTNVEREVLKAASLRDQNDLGIHVSIDKNHYFHVSSCIWSKSENKFKSINFTQSSTVGIVDSIFDKIA